MKINCEHWQDIGLPDAGQCALGKFQGRPSLGTCAVCMGVKPIAKATVALPAILTLEQRVNVIAHRSVCESCEHARGFTQVTVKCLSCGCAGREPAQWKMSEEQMAGSPPSVKKDVFMPSGWV